MAITAQFDADFSAFNSEVGKAEQQLNLFEMSTAKTSTAITGMGTTTTKTAPGVNTLTTSLREFDGVLGAAGIHIGPAIKGIEDLGAASGKSVAELGKFAAAGLVVSTALAAWTVGRGAVAILKWFNVDLDGAIANATAKWMGWGDLVGATAGANADVLKLASDHAKRTITDINEARAINQKWVDDLKKGAKETAQANEEAAKAAEAWAKAMDTVRAAGQNHEAVLRAMNAATVAAAKAALEHGVSLDTVATAYKLTASQIAAVEAAFKSEQAAAKASADEHKRITDELKTHWDAVLKIRDEALGKDAVEKATQWTEAILLLGNSVKTLSQDQLVELQKTMNEAMTAMARNGNLTAEQAAQFNDFSAAAAAAAAALKPVVDVTNELAAAQTDVVATSGAALDALNQVNAAANTWGMHPGGQVPASTGLTQVSRIGGDQFLVNPKTGEVIQKLQRQYGDSFLGWGPQGAPPMVNLNVEGNILGTQDGLAKLISDALTYSYRSGGNRLPA
jgi:hypothetical protein